MDAPQTPKQGVGWVSTTLKRNNKAILNVEVIRKNMDEPRVLDVRLSEGEVIWLLAIFLCLKGRVVSVMSNFLTGVKLIIRHIPCEDLKCEQERTGDIFGNYPLMEKDFPQKTRRQCI